ncbi:MAG: DUF1266 domain-containing protein, partial [Bacteroidota bacterium]
MHFIAVALQVCLLFLSVGWIWFKQKRKKQSLKWRARQILTLVAVQGLIFILYQELKYGPLIFMLGLALQCVAVIWAQVKWRVPLPLYLRDWPLAATWPLALQHRWPQPELLAGDEAGPKLIRRAKIYLKKEWDILDHEDWQDTLNWLLEEGHRVSFHREIGDFLELSAGEQAAYVEKIQRGEGATEDGAERAEHLARLEWASQAGAQLQKQSFMGWDLLRFMELCRWGIRVGWVSGDEVLPHMLAAGQLLQQRCASWEEAYQQYLAGMRYW